MAIHLLTEQRVGPLNERQADLVFAAREDCERLRSVGDELLDASRIQAGRIELRVEPCEVGGLVRAALDAQQGFAAERRIALRGEVLPGLPPVQADAERVGLVLANLLQNAVRHSPPGGAVAVRAFEAGSEVRFEVDDAGSGVPPEHREAIFEKYFRLPGAPKGGVGLGLFIAREIVQAHGGAIGVEPGRSGRGSTFWFTLRAVEAGSVAAS
jgi:signal transduction histidine kinase